MNPAMLQQFLSVALPIMVTLVATIWIAQWSQNKRFDDLKTDMNRRFDEVIKRLDRNHEERIVRFEKRISPVRRG